MCINYFFDRELIHTLWSKKSLWPWIQFKIDRCFNKEWKKYIFLSTYILNSEYVIELLWRPMKICMTKKLFIALVLSKQAHTWFLNHIYLGSTRRQKLLSFWPCPWLWSWVHIGVRYSKQCPRKVNKTFVYFIRNTH